MSKTIERIIHGGIDNSRTMKSIHEIKEENIMKKSNANNTRTNTHTTINNTKEENTMKKSNSINLSTKAPITSMTVEDFIARMTAAGINLSVIKVDNNCCGISGCGNNPGDEQKAMQLIQELVTRNKLSAFGLTSFMNRVAQTIAGENEATENDEEDEEEAYNPAVEDDADETYDLEEEERNNTYDDDDEFNKKYPTMAKFVKNIEESEKTQNFKFHSWTTIKGDDVMLIASKDAVHGIIYKYNKFSGRYYAIDDNGDVIALSAANGNKGSKKQSLKTNVLKRLNDKSARNLFKF